MDEQNTTPNFEAQVEALRGLIQEGNREKILGGLDAMKTVIAELQTKQDEFLSGWQRAVADYANLKKEADKAKREVGAYAIGSFIELLLPVVEGFRQATAHRPLKEGEPLDEKRIVQWVDGIGHVRTQLDSVLAGAGVKPINEENVPFDPNLHEAMLSEVREGVAPGTVLKILEGGARLNDRILKPARVVVSE